MAIITISRGSYSRGRQVAEAVAERLGYSCLARDVLLEASREFDVPEIKLVRAIEEAPGFLQTFSHSKERYIALIRAALLKHAKDDDIVYHGLAGHIFLEGVQHLLKVRIIAPLEDRLATVVQRDGVDLTAARSIIERADRDRRRWSQQLYGIDNEDPSRYDLVLNVARLTVEDATEVICNTVKLPRFTTTDASAAAVAELALSAEVMARIFDIAPSAKVEAKDGRVVISVREKMLQAAELQQQLTTRITGIEGLLGSEVRVDFL